MVLTIAVARVAGTRQPREDITVLLVVLGGSLAALNDLTYLSYTRWWRHGGFSPTPDIVAFGVTSDAIDNPAPTSSEPDSSSSPSASCSWRQPLVASAPDGVGSAS